MDTSMNMLKMKYPASWHKALWREGIPLGNGELGALVMGGVGKESVIFNHSRLWLPGTTMEVPDVSDALLATRKMMDQGDYVKASPMICQALIDKGYCSEVEYSYPLTELSFDYRCDKPFKKYLRTLDMENAECTVKYEADGVKHLRKCFVSRVDNVFVYEYSLPDSSINVNMSMDFVHTNDIYSEEIYSSVKDTVQKTFSDGFLTFSANNGMEYGAVCRIVTDGDALFDGNILKIKNAKNLTLLLMAFVGEKTSQAVCRAKKEIGMLGTDYEQLFKANIKAHKELYSKTDISLSGNGVGLLNEELLLDAYDGEISEELMEKLWRFGRYLYVSATREDGLPAVMYGLWKGEYKLVWDINMANVNLEMINWNATKGGLSSLLMPVINYYFDHMDIYRHNAQRIFGCRGIYIPSITTPNIHTLSILVPVISNWISGAGWIAQHFFDYYKYTGDLETLKNKIMPFLYECIAFYRDYVIIDKDGKYKFYPSVSPENTPGNFMPEDFSEDMGHIMPSAINATMDIAIMKEVISNFIEGSALTGQYKDEIAEITAMQERFPDYSVNRDGALKEWIFDDFEENYNHRHYSHLYPLFPGDEFIQNEDAEMIKAAEKALKMRDLRGQSGWSFPMSANIYARLGDGDSALNSIALMARTCLLNNFFTLHNDWRKMGATFDLGTVAPVQMDAIIGTASVLQEMLLYSSPKIIKLLPALPERLNRVKVKNLCFCSGSASFEWDGETLDCVLTFERQSQLKVMLPENFQISGLSSENCICEKISDNGLRVACQSGSLKITAKKYNWRYIDGNIVSKSDKRVQGQAVLELERKAVKG